MKHFLLYAVLGSIFFASICNNAICQERGHYKFGEVSMEELQIPFYERDTSAAAIVLYSGGEFAMDAKLSSVFTVRKSYTKRIRIFKPEGKKYATVTVPYKRLSKYTERVDGIEAYVYRLEGNEIVSRKMDKDSIRETKYNFKKREVTFTVPDALPGTVIEYKYTVVGTMPQYYEESEYIKASYMDYFFKSRHDLEGGGRINEDDNSTTKYVQEGAGFGEDSMWDFSFGDFSGISFTSIDVDFMDGMVSGDDIMFPKWYFQEDIPVVKSVLEFTNFEELMFEAVVTGLEKPEVILNEGRLYKVNRSLGYSDQVYSISKPNLIQRKPTSQQWRQDPYEEKPLVNRVFIAENLPAITEDCPENFVINAPKYRMAVELDFKGNKSNSGERRYSYNWYHVDNILYKDAELGRRFMFAPNLYKDSVKHIMDSNMSDFNKAEAICSVIKNDIECTSFGKAEKIRPVKEAFETKKGSDMEINALVMAAFRNTGFHTNLILLKSRDRGQLTENETTVGTMNTSVVQITLKNGENVYFDPSIKDIGVNILNHLHLTDKGRIYQKGPVWVDLANIVENKEHHTAVLNVDEKGVVEGKVYTVATNHCCYDQAEQVKEAVIQEVYFNKLKEKIKGEFINGYTYKADTTNNIFKRDFEFRRSSAVLVDNKILVNPFVEVYHNMDEFPQEQREYPVELKYPKTIEYSANIIIPPGYEVDNLPQNRGYTMGTNGSRVSIRCSSEKNVVMFGLTIMLKDIFIPVKDYPLFKDFWKEMCSLFDEVVVLRKIGDKPFTESEEIE